MNKRRDFIENSILRTAGITIDSMGFGPKLYSFGSIFYWTEGCLELGSGEWKAYRQRENEPFTGTEMQTKGERQEAPDIVGDLSSEHFGNFINAIRIGNNDDLNCDIIEGHYSSALSLLANISYRLERELKSKGEHEKFIGDSEADIMLTRKYRNPYFVHNEV